PRRDDRQGRTEAARGRRASVRGVVIAMTDQAQVKPATGGISDLRLSRVGKRPVELPKGVTASIANGKIDVKGPKGQLSRIIPPNVDVKVEAGKVVVKPTIGGRDGARFQGLARALISGM